MFTRIKRWLKRNDDDNGDDDYWAGRGGSDRGGGSSQAAHEARFRVERGQGAGQYDPGAFG